MTDSDVTATADTAEPAETYRGWPVVHSDYRNDRPIFGHYASLDAEREIAPFLWNVSTKHPFWMITRFEHVVEALRMPEVFSNDVINALQPKMAVRFLPQNLNGAEHTRMRRVLNRWFSPAAVRRMEPTIRSHCRALVEEVRPKGSCDFVAEFAIRFPTDMFLATLGLPLEDGPRFLRWVEQIFSSYSGGRAAIDASQQMKEYFAEKIEDRLRNPRDPEWDFLTRLLTAEPEGEKFSREDILTICMTLVTAGLDTTRAALGYIFHHLATHEEHRRQLIDQPELIPRAVEELVRIYTLLIQDGRLVTQDIDFHGCPMKKGDVVWLGLAQANHDPRKFPNPMTYDLSRPNLNQHLGFGAGPHRCLGMHLARHELVVAIEEWHRVIPDYELATDEPLMERGGQLTLKSLPLRWAVQ
ncbi:MAG TPA: cytochrome P450 [Micromonospora sp.]